MRPAATLLICLAFVCTSPAHAGPAPTGVFVLGTAAAGTTHLTDNYRQAIAAENASGQDLFSGYVLRVLYKDLVVNDNATSGAIQYDFTPVAAAIEEIQSRTDGVRPAGLRDAVTLQVIFDSAPPIVLAQVPAGERYVPDPLGAPGVEWPIPWAPSAVAVVAGLQTQLANVFVHDASQPGSPLVVLRDHPTLVAHMVLPYGMRGYRDNDPPQIRVTTLPGYSRSALLTGYLATAQAYADAFPGDFCYWQYFSMNDGVNTPTLDSDMNTLLSATFNGAGQRTFGVFRENLSDNGPSAAAGQQLLDFEAPGFVNDPQGHVLFQALTSWIAPFTNPSIPTDREPKTASGSPSFGALLAYRDFGTRYHEWYVTDLTLTDIAIQNRFAFLPPYGTAAVQGSVPLADVPGIRAALWSRVSGWNRWLRDGVQPVADAFVVNAGSASNALGVLANDPLPPDALPSREAPPVGLAQVRAPLALRVSAVTPAAHGSIVIAPGGQSLLYTPAPGFVGADSVRYTVTDDVAATAIGRVTIQVDGVLAVGATGELALRGPFPNPSAGVARFAIALPRALPVRVRVHDVRGALVRDTGELLPDAGSFEFTVARESLAPGVYLVDVRAGGERWVRRVLMR